MYLRTGAALGEFRTSKAQDNFDFDQHRFGYHLGLGYNFDMSRRWHMLDYSYNGYSEISIAEEEGSDNEKVCASLNHYSIGAFYYLNSLDLDAIKRPHFA